MAARGTAVLASCAFAFVQLQVLLPTFHLVQPGGKSLLLYPQSWNPQDHPKGTKEPWIGNYFSWCLVGLTISSK